MICDPWLFTSFILKENSQGITPGLCIVFARPPPESDGSKCWVPRGWQAWGRLQCCCCVFVFGKQNLPPKAAVPPNPHVRSRCLPTARLDREETADPRVSRVPVLAQLASQVPGRADSVIKRLTWAPSTQQGKETVEGTGRKLWHVVGASALSWSWFVGSSALRRVTSVNTGTRAVGSRHAGFTGRGNLRDAP